MGRPGKSTRGSARPVRLTRNALLVTKLPAWRSRFMLGLVAIAFVALGLRAFWLQVWSNDFLQAQGKSRYERTLEIPANRGRIVDRNGAMLATSLPAKAVWADPDDVQAPRDKLVTLAKLLQMEQRELDRRLAEEKNYVYLRRQVEADVAARVAELKIPGVHQRNEFKRHYPEGETVAHVVGFTNVEDAGQEGFELAQQQRLSGKPGSRRVIKDNLGRVIEQIGSGREPQDGADLALSIDMRVQFLAFNALRDAIREHRAKAGAAIVVDVRTGEVIALANWPTYDPNQRGQLTGAQLRNRAITDTFEPGSTMKAFSVAMALESGRFRPASMIDTSPGRMTIGSATIGDAHRYGVLSVEEVLQKSSNVGTVKMALTLPPQKMWEHFTSLGFGQAPQIGFPGAVAGRVRPHKTWKPIEQATMSYGHGISVSLMQMARAYTVFARDGELIPVTMLRADGPAQGVRVFRPETAQSVLKMLEMAAGPKGTAPLAQIPGYRVGGKTGTAHKQEGGTYQNKYIASFVGLAPVSAPRIVVAVMVDEPSAGKYYGGQVAAPVFARIAGETLRAMRVAPDAPFSTLIVPADPVKESL
ncbi:MAG TPA: penicillin-binding protein 2 [Burkholderiaceae bacterium]|nr:penicillin-binding protein 2 [Burkholderiaceae bacterium]